jgi:hypothetical protein
MKRFVVLPLLLAFLIVGASCTSIIPVIVAFNVTPTVITAGGSATLIWNVSGANSVIIDQGLGSLPPAGSQVVSPNVTTVYTLQASNIVGTVSKSVVITVNPAPIVIDFSVNPAVINSGSSAALIWDVSGANSALIDQGVGNVPLSGEQQVSPTATTTYTITASGAGGTITKSVILTVNPPVVATFSINPNVIDVGESATLQWNVTGADSVTIDQGIGDVPPIGSRIVSPNYTTTYTLTASSSCCTVSKAAVLTVGSYYQHLLPFGYPQGNPYGYPYGYPYMPQQRYANLAPIVDILNITPQTITVGNSATLHWYVTGATAVYITEIGSVPSSGSIMVSPRSTTTYHLTANNAFGATSRSVTVNVK